MKRFTLILFSACFMLMNSNSQTIELTFTAIDSTTHVQLDSIKVMNRTQGSDTVLYYPDTLLVLDYQVGISETNIDTKEFQVFQNYPNPMANQTTISLYIPEKDNVTLIVTDILGRKIIKTEKVLEKGVQLFRFTPGDENLYFFTAQWRGNRNSIKMLHTTSHSLGQSALEYYGPETLITQLKAAENIQGFNFNIGDELLYIGYADTLQSGMLGSPETSKVYTFQFAYNIPCPGTPTIEYDDQVYNTVQIMSQCWMKENLNVGIMLNAPASPSDNDTIEKYCMGNMEVICDEVGGLYFWNEMMNYTNQTGGQGICPDGWHIPTDMEWKILEGGADTESNIGDMEWTSSGWRGVDAGGHLKQTGNEYWEVPNTGATDIYGFSALPGGYFVQGDFWGPGYKGIIWSSESQGKYLRQMDWNQQMIKRESGGSPLAISVRCLKN